MWSASDPTLLQAKRLSLGASVLGLTNDHLVAQNPNLLASLTTDGGSNNRGRQWCICNWSGIHTSRRGEKEGGAAWCNADHGRRSFQWFLDCAECWWLTDAVLLSLAGVEYASQRFTSFRRHLSRSHLLSLVFDKFLPERPHHYWTNLCYFDQIDYGGLLTDFINRAHQLMKQGNFSHTEI